MFQRLRKWFSPGPPTLESFIRASYSTSSSEIITAKSILRIPAVSRATDIISSSVARIGFDVFKTLPDGSREVDKNHPSHQLLKLRPNGMFSRFQLVKSWVLNALTYGDGYIYIRRDELGRPTELLLLDSGSTSIAIEGTQLSYATPDSSGRLERIPASQVAHLRFNSTDGIAGQPVYQLLADAFGLSLTLQRYQNLFFENGGRPSVVVILPPEVQAKEQIEEFRDGWNNIHSGPSNSFRPALAKNGTDIKTLQNDSAIESLANLRESDLVTIANCMGIVPHKIGSKANSSYKSLTEENLAFLSDLDGWVSQAEQELSFKLLRQSEITSHYIEGNREALLQSDPETKERLLSNYRKSGLMSDEEIRRAMNRPVDFSGTFWTESNLITREKALQVEEPEPEPIQEQEAEPVEENEETKTEQLAKQLTTNTVDRLLRRAEKSGKFDMELWQSEFGALPGFAKLSLPDDELGQVLSEQRTAVIQGMDANKITEELWTAI